MWLEITYRPTTLFSLKQSSATNSAGKTLFTPSPYSVKMALINAIITYDSIDKAIENFDMIKNLEIQFALPHRLTVNNCFVKIQKEKRHESKKDKLDTFQSTVAFREYIYFNGDIKIAFNANDRENQNALIDFLWEWSPKINYFGKRSCFFQFITLNELEVLPEYYSRTFNKLSEITPGMFFSMDDFGKKATFDKINTYTNTKTDRESKIYILPIMSTKSNKNFAMYERIN